MAFALLGGATLPRWLSGREERLCAGAEGKLVGVWDADRKAAVRAAFKASGEPFAEASWAEVERGLDAYAAAWVSGHTDACKAARVRGEEPEDVLAARMVCMDSRLREMKALVNVFAEQGKATVGKAVQATSALTPTALCSDVAALMSPIPPLETPPRWPRSTRSAGGFHRRRR